jgi:tetratricopeptide (TPR) repeat protein
MNPRRGTFTALAIILLVLYAGGVRAQDARVAELSARAQEMYEQKKIREAINLWLQALAIDPNNEQVQQKIEIVYETKHRRDISLQRAKLYLRIAARGLMRRIFQK